MTTIALPKRTALNLMLIAGVSLALLMALLLCIGTLTLQHKPNALDYAAILIGPSDSHVLGTDALGRDLLARIIYGGYNSLFIGACVMLATMNRLL